jgi:hypothetical protein
MSKPMSYEEALRIKLGDRMGPVFFSDLKAHLERDAVIIVAQELELLDVAVAVANDDADKVKDWIESGKMRKPSLLERDEWPAHEGRTWEAVIVKPFVLVQDARDPGAKGVLLS